MTAICSGHPVKGHLLHHPYEKVRYGVRFLQRLRRRSAVWRSNKHSTAPRATARLSRRSARAAGRRQIRHRHWSIEGPLSGQQTSAQSGRRLERRACMLGLYGSLTYQTHLRKSAPWCAARRQRAASLYPLWHRQFTPSPRAFTPSSLFTCNQKLLPRHAPGFQLLLSRAMPLARAMLDKSLSPTTQSPACWK